MKTYIVTLAAAMVLAGAGAVHAASMTVTMNAIDANGIGKKKMTHPRNWGLITRRLGKIFWTVADDHRARPHLC